MWSITSRAVRYEIFPMSYICHGNLCHVAERRHFHTIVQVHKILSHLIPAYLQDTFMFTRDLTRLVGRNSHRLFIPRMRTTYGLSQKSLFYRGAVAWNNLNQTLYSITI